ncbi:hypothetical protein H0H93_001579 [Arthromyces matolae]|nr:hypothetical protein H0H93_001579 [Arthromyces matolae]
MVDAALGWAQQANASTPPERYFREETSSFVQGEEDPLPSTQISSPCPSEMPAETMAFDTQGPPPQGEAYLISLAMSTYLTFTSTELIEVEDNIGITLFEQTLTTTEFHPTSEHCPLPLPLIIPGAISPHPLSNSYATFPTPGIPYLPEEPLPALPFVSFEPELPLPTNYSLGVPSHSHTRKKSRPDPSQSHFASPLTENSGKERRSSITDKISHLPLFHAQLPFPEEVSVFQESTSESTTAALETVQASTPTPSVYVDELTIEPPHQPAEDTAPSSG